MKLTTTTITLAAALAALLLAAPASAVLIDDFTAASSDTVSPGPGGTFSVTPGGPSIFGGEREVILSTPDGGTVTVETAIGTGIPDAVMAYSSSSGTTGDFILIYDGPGVMGLVGSGIDLTDGGVDNAFNIAVNFSDFSSLVDIFVIDGSGAGAAAGPFPLPPLLTGGAPVGVPIPYAAFPGVDFTDIEFLSFTFTAPTAATDLEILFLDTTTIVPEPSTLVGLSLAGVALLIGRKLRSC